MLSAIGQWARRRALASSPWTNVYGTARTLLALGTALTLLCTPADALFVRGAGMDSFVVCRGGTVIGAFCVAGPAHLELTRWLLFAALVVVASGWRPRLTALVHWWIAFSVQNNAVVVDGGDQVTMVLTALMVPLALTDPRRWHWQAMPRWSDPTLTQELRLMIGWFTAWVLRVQVAGIYFHASIGKFGVEQWTDGTALWYIAHQPMVGWAPWLRALLEPILKTAAGVTLLTWSVLMLEYLLSIALFVPRPWQRRLLWAGVALHGGILVLHGLVSFGLAMFGALILYLRPYDELFRWRFGEPRNRESPDAVVVRHSVPRNGATANGRRRAGADATPQHSSQKMRCASVPSARPRDIGRGCGK